MALQTNGPISLEDIQNEFGGNNPISIDEYYSGGQYVPAGTSGINGPIPSSGEISLFQFYGASSTTWTTRVGGTSIQSIAYSPELNLYVCISNYYGLTYILTSTNGISWTTRLESNISSGATSKIIWTGSKFIVATGYYDTGTTSGLIISSLDGITWTQTILSSNRILNSIALSNTGLLVAVGDYGTILTSPDGITWTSRISGTTRNLKNIFWSDSLFVAVGASGTIRTSPDGITWTSRSSRTTADLNGITWSGSLFVAVGNSGTIRTSPDGITWTSRSSGTTNNLNAVIYSSDNSKYIIVGIKGTILTSTNATTWIDNLSGTTNSIFDITQSNNKYIAVGNEIYTSSDATEWETVRLYTSPLRSVTYSPFLDLYVAVGGDATYTYDSLLPGTITISDDGIDWSSRLSNIDDLARDQLNHVRWIDDQFIAVGTSGLIYTSTNGISWTKRSSGTTNNLNGVTRSTELSLFVVVGASGTIRTSTSTTSWTSRSTGTSNTLNAISWSGSIFVVVGNSGTILTSSDGITWTNRTSNVDANLYSVTWSGTQFIAVGGVDPYTGSTILTSSDGITWNSINHNITGSLIDIIWTGSKFIAAGLTIPAIVSSIDGVSWNKMSDVSTSYPTQNPSLSSVSFRGIAQKNSQIVIVGGGDGQDIHPIGIFSTVNLTPGVIITSP